MFSEKGSKIFAKSTADPAGGGTNGNLFGIAPAPFTVVKGFAKLGLPNSGKSPAPVEINAKGGASRF